MTSAELSSLYRCARERWFSTALRVAERRDAKVEIDHDRWDRFAARAVALISHWRGGKFLCEGKFSCKHCAAPWQRYVASPIDRCDMCGYSTAVLNEVAAPQRTVEVKHG